MRPLIDGQTNFNCLFQSMHTVRNAKLASSCFEHDLSIFLIQNTNILFKKS